MKQLEKYIYSGSAEVNHEAFLGKHYYGTEYGRRKIVLSNEELDEILSRTNKGYTVRFDNRLTLQQYEGIIKQLNKRSNI